VPRVFERDDARPEMVRSGASYLSVIGKLRAGQSLAQAEAELKTIDARYNAIGIYGVTAHSVTQRKQELGIRVAMGATPSDILCLVVGHGLRLTFVGAVIGVITSFLLARLLSGLLFGVQALDPLTFMLAALIPGRSVLACYMPARRATRVDPIVVLRFQ